MDIEIKDYSDKSYSFIQIASLGFVGTIDWAISRRYGLAHGKITRSGQVMALYLRDGAIMWKAPKCAPFDVRFSGDGWGGFTDGNEIVAFNADGIVFRASKPPGLPSICSVSLGDDEMIFQGERFEFVYDLSGKLLERVCDSEELFKPGGPAWLRWERLEKAEALLGEAKAGDAVAAENAAKILNICAKQFGDNPAARAKCHRYLGEIELLAGRERKAADQWRIALKIDGKVGVKRQLQALEKKLS